MGNARGFKELKEAPALQPARKWGPPPYDNKKLNLADTLNDHKNPGIPQGFGKKGSSAYILIPALRDSKQKMPLSHTGPRLLKDKTVIINGCCFKLLQL